MQRQFANNSALFQHLSESLERACQAHLWLWVSTVYRCVDGRDDALPIVACENQMDQKKQKKQKKRNPNAVETWEGFNYQLGIQTMNDIRRLDRQSGQFVPEQRETCNSAKKFGITSDGTLEYDERKWTSEALTGHLTGDCGPYPAWNAAMQHPAALRYMCNATYAKKRQYNDTKPWDKYDDWSDGTLLAIHKAMCVYEEYIAELVRKLRGLKYLPPMAKRPTWWVEAMRILIAERRTVRILGVDIGQVNYGACMLELCAVMCTTDNALVPFFRIFHWGLLDLKHGNGTDRNVIYDAPDAVRDADWVALLPATNAEGLLPSINSAAINAIPVTITPRPRAKHTRRVSDDPPRPKRRRLSKAREKKDDTNDKTDEIIILDTED